ncbi:MAG: ferrous iron transport protein A [Aigarchaeota archaeon]|nr:ferrous iron transport protein A [Candidatus Wolframiiraptor gerlachensis]
MRVPLTSLSEASGGSGCGDNIWRPSPSTGFWGGFRRRLGWGWRGRGGPGCSAVKRLADLGILPGAKIKVVRKAPL